MNCRKKMIDLMFEFQEELNVIREWAISKGLPINGEAGYWTGNSGFSIASIGIIFRFSC